MQAGKIKVHTLDSVATELRPVHQARAGKVKAYTPDIPCSARGAILSRQNCAPCVTQKLEKLKSIHATELRRDRITPRQNYAATELRRNRIAPR